MPNHFKLALLIFAATCALETRVEAGIRPSPSLAILQNEAQKNLTVLGTSEDVKNQAAQAFTGEGPSYHFEGTTPFPGFTIYNPVMDSPGNDSTSAEKPKYDWKKDWRVYAGTAAAATAGGLFLSPLLFLGGLLAGVGLALFILEKKFGSIPS